MSDDGTVHSMARRKQYVIIISSDMSDGETSIDLAPGPGQVTTPTNYPSLQTVLLVRPARARDPPTQVGHIRLVRCGSIFL